MRKIGFIGAYDKTDFIIFIARALVAMDKKVLVVDTTMSQKAKYIVPAISPSISYITEYEQIDVAVGLYSFEEIANYLGMQVFDQNEYDFVLIDIDKPEMIESFCMYDANKNYFVTSFDLYSLKRGIEILSGVKEPMDLTKILFSKYMSQEEDEYLNFLSLGQKIKWNEERIYFPFDNGDQSVIIENQRIEKIKIKGLSAEYRDALMYLTSKIIEDEKVNIRKAFKQLD
jgi:hypothetical protein